MATNTNITSRYDNVSDRMLADMIGHADATAKAAAEELASLKDELKRRKLEQVEGDLFMVTNKEQMSVRLDTKAVTAFLGPKAEDFKTLCPSQVIRIKARAAALASMAV